MKLKEKHLNSIGKIWSDILVTIQIANNEPKLSHFHTLSNHELECMEDVIMQIWMDGLTAKDLHKIWMDFHIKKDHTKKTHPCIVEFDKLNFYQKLKYEILITIIKTYKEDILSKCD